MWMLCYVTVQVLFVINYYFVKEVFLSRNIISSEYTPCMQCTVYTCMHSLRSGLYWCIGALVLY